MIQARCGSSRLPGKVLAETGAGSVLGLMLRRLESLADRPEWTLVVATSDLQRDDPVATGARNAGVEVVRGDERDVLSRVWSAVERHPADVVVRLTADCPLADPEVVRAAVDRLTEVGADYVSNTLVRTFPDGLDVEALRSEALHSAAMEAELPEEREHVTPFVYRRPRRFAIAQITTDELAGGERWTIDTAEDLEWLRRAVADHPSIVTAGWLDVLHALGRHARPPADEIELRPITGESVVGQPFVRRWRADRAGVTIGVVEVIVDEARGRWHTDVPVAARAGVSYALRRTLQADLQVASWEPRS